MAKSIDKRLADLEKMRRAGTRLFVQFPEDDAPPKGYDPDQPGHVLLRCVWDDTATAEDKARAFLESMPDDTLAGVYHGDHDAALDAFLARLDEDERDQLARGTQP